MKIFTMCKNKQFGYDDVVFGSYGYSNGNHNIKKENYNGMLNTEMLKK